MNLTENNSMIIIWDFDSHYFMQLDMQDHEMYLLQILQWKSFTTMDASFRSFIIQDFDVAQKRLMVI